jgi:N-acetyl-alpha-D-glucosaminyl L-malate synthase BshA
LRIGIVCYPTYGGSGVVATELGRWLARRGHTVHLMSYARPFRFTTISEPNLLFHKVDLFDYSVFPAPSYTLSLAVKILELGRDLELDVIHVHYAVPHAVSAYLARQMYHPRRLAIVTTLHGTDITLVGRNPGLLPVVRFAIQQSDAVTAVSNWLREQTVSQFDVRNSIEVIPNFVDADLFQPSPPWCRMKSLAEPDEKIILHISNFRPVKRVTDIVRAFALVREKVRAKLVMVGDGPDRDKAEAMARDLGVIEHVVFPGKHASVECFHAIADLFVFASENESFGLAALEALSCEVPVIGYMAGGLPELVRNGETGCLVPLGNVEALACCATELLRNTDRAKAMGKRAREIVLEQYLPSRIVPLYEAVYQKAMTATTAVV